MVHFLSRFFAIVFMIMGFQPLNAAEKYIIDNQHSYVLWHIQHLGFSTQTGKWYAKGILMLDKEDPQKSSVEATINIAEMITGLPELDKHLRDKTFFDTDKFPTATFVSNEVKRTGETTAKVLGRLTLHGVSKPVTLFVTLNKAGKHPMNNIPTAGFSATATIKRSDFGMGGSIPALSDEVNLDIGIEANLASQ